MGNRNLNRLVSLRERKEMRQPGSAGRDGQAGNSSVPAGMMCLAYLPMLHRITESFPSRCLGFVNSLQLYLSKLVLEHPGERRFWKETQDAGRVERLGNGD